MAIEAWRWTADLAADVARSPGPASSARSASSAWRDRAADQASRLALHAGSYADGLLAAAQGAQRAREMRRARGPADGGGPITAGQRQRGHADRVGREAQVPHQTAVPHAQRRERRRAVAHAQRAGELTAGKDPSVLDTLAAAYAETGNFTQALTVGRHALDLAQQVPALLVDRQRAVDQRRILALAACAGADRIRVIAQSLGTRRNDPRTTGAEKR